MPMVSKCANEECLQNEDGQCSLAEVTINGCGECEQSEYEN